MEPIPDSTTGFDIARHPTLLRDMARFFGQIKSCDVLLDGGVTRRFQLTPKSANSLLDLRNITSTVPAYRALPRSPADISNLELWLKADALGLTNGAPVELWTDSSSYGRNLSATGATCPTFVTGVVSGVMPAVRFDGVDDLMINTGVGKLFTACTVFMVTKQTGAGNIQTLFGWNKPGGGTSIGLSLHALSTLLGPLAMSINPVAGNVPVAGIQPRDNHHAFTWQFAGGSIATAASYTYYDNGLLQPPYPTTNIIGSGPDFGITLGGAPTGYFGGDIAEMLVYSVSLTTAERQEIEDYLFVKYGLAGKPPPPGPGTIPAPGTGSAATDDDCVTCLKRLVVAADGVVCSENEVVWV